MHQPCTHRHLPHGRLAVHRLLQRIPGLSIWDLTGDALCCGAAGAYMLEQPCLSEALLRDTIDRLAERMPDILVTTNHGCALQLAAGVRSAGLEIEVCHPVALIARQLLVAGGELRRGGAPALPDA